MNAEHAHQRSHSAPCGLTCKAVAKQSGKPCQTPPLRGTRYCLFHTADNARVLGTRGGHRRAIYNPDQLEPLAAPKNAVELRDFLAQTMVETRSGKIEPNVANALAILSRAYLRALEIIEFEPRLQAVEMQLMPGKTALVN